MAVFPHTLGSEDTTYVRALPYVACQCKKLGLGAPSPKNKPQIFPTFGGRLLASQALYRHDSTEEITSSIDLVGHLAALFGAVTRPKSSGGQRQKGLFSPNPNFFAQAFYTRGVYPLLGCVIGPKV